MAEAMRRPWSIHLYALITLSVGLDGYIGALGDLRGWELAFEDMVPQLAWNTDMAIVALSARFTIVCIPVAAIWVWGARFARVLVTLFTALLLIGFLRTLGAGITPIEPLDGVKTLALGLAWAALFTPSANAWLQPKQEKTGVEVFE